MTSAPEIIELRSQDDGKRSVLVAQRMAKQAGFDAVGQNRFATAVSELVQNVLRYAKSGRATLRVLERAGRLGLEAIVEDSGPGISDVTRAMQERMSTGGGLGLGLPGTRRMMDDFELVSTPGVGTCVSIRLWRRG